MEGGRRPATWIAPWAGVAMAAAVAATTMDAVLLQLRRSFFTGGFLAADHLTSLPQTAAFLAASLASDLSAIGIAALLVLWLLGRWRVNRVVAMTVTGALVIGPIVAANVVAYQLATHLGDAFDLALMFTLADRSPAEFLAVSSEHVVRLGVAAAAVVGAVVAVSWLAKGRIRLPAARMPAVPGRFAVWLSVALVVAGAAVTLAARTGSDVFDNGLRRKPTGQWLGVLINMATDFDRDGYGVLGRPPDPDLFDARVYPYALEVPGNGIDENGVGGDLPPDLPPYTEPRLAGRWQQKPDVVLIVLETFRADAVGAVVNGRPVTPVLDALAASGVSVEQAYSHNGYTVQSRRHLFTGSLADLHGGTTLIDDFNANGYETAYFSAQDESFGGPDQGVGFDRAGVSYDARSDRDRRYSRFTTPGSLAVPHTVLNERISDFLNARSGDRPLFLYVNFHDTHFPYHHDGLEPLVSDAYVSERHMARETGVLREMYLNAAANVDRAIGEMLSGVRRSLGRDPGVVVLSDHGESLFEEGFLGHGYALNDAQTRIPLIVANLPLSIVEPFGQVDLRRLLHDALSAPEAAAMRPTVRRDDSRTVFQYLGRLDRAAQVAWVGSRGRLIYDLRARQAEVFGAPWRRESALDGADRDAALDLIHTWESMLLARDAAANGEP